MNMDAETTPVEGAPKKEVTPEEEAAIEAQMLAAMAETAVGPAAQAAVPAPAPTADPVVETQRPQFQELSGTGVSDDSTKRLDLLMDLTLPVAIELGRTQMPIKNILGLKRGAVVEFERLASEPVDMLINGRKMADGEVVVIEKHFALRITSLVEADERIRGLGR
jgi:flagellar motor switch protein FliN/FliY